jgi:hypothetical protein
MLSKCELSNVSRTTTCLHLGFFSILQPLNAFVPSEKAKCIHLEHLCPYGAENPFLTETTECVRLDRALVRVTGT